MTAGALAEQFDMTKPSMSHHFTVLKDADLITSRREGQQIWYALNTTVVQDLMAWAIDLLGEKQRKRSKQDDTKILSVAIVSDRRSIGSNNRSVSAAPLQSRHPLGRQHATKRL
jgi:DNA-binding transcriptional ArsR family regulator